MQTASNSKAMAEAALRAVAAVLALGLVARLLWPVPLEAARAAARGVPLRSDEALTAVVSAAALAGLAWLALGLLLEVLCVLPGAGGRAARAATLAVTPSVVRRAAGLVLGVGVVGGLAPGAAVAAPDRAAFFRSSLMGPAVAGPADARVGGLAGSRFDALPDPAFGASASSGMGAGPEPGIGALQDPESGAPPGSGMGAGADPGRSTNGRELRFAALPALRSAAPVESGAAALPDPGWGRLALPAAAPGPARAQERGWVPTRPKVRVQPDVRVLSPSPPAPAPDAPAEVVVRRGDSLWSIAARHLGRHAGDAEVARAWPAWFDANRGVIGDDPDVLRPGQVLHPPEDVRS